MPNLSRSVEKAREWAFLTNHARVLLCIAADPQIRMRDIAHNIGLTERAVQRIAAELAEGGYLTAERVGRRNRYTVNDQLPLGHPLDAHQTVRQLLSLTPTNGRKDR